AYAQAQGLWRNDGDADPVYTDVLELDLDDVVPSLAGPKRPQDRVLLSKSKNTFLKQLADMTKDRDNDRDRALERFAGEGGGTAVGATEVPVSAEVTYKGETFTLCDGAIVIAAITSCTKTYNTVYMMGLSTR